MANDAACVACKRGSEQVPLISFQYRGADLFICPQHLPVLIHDPAKLAEVIPGADGFQPAGHHD